MAGFGLIDTGASVTCVDEDAAKQLKLPVVDVVNMSSASHAAHQANVYPVRIGIAGLPNAINAPRAVGAALKAQGLIVLLGRDILAHCTLFYNGAAGEITYLRLDCLIGPPRYGKPRTTSARVKWAEPTA